MLLPKNPDFHATSLISGGVPGLALDITECTVDIDEATNILNVTLYYYRIETNMEQSVTAKYPLVDVTTKQKIFDCTEEIHVDENMEVSAE